MSDIEKELARVVVLLSEKSEGNTIKRMANGARIALECCDFLQVNHAAIASALADQRRYRYLCGEKSEGIFDVLCRESNEPIGGEMLSRAIDDSTLPPQPDSQIGEG